MHVTAPGKVRAALILGALSAFAPLSIDMYLPAFPAMTGQLSATASEIQLTLTTFVVSLAIGQAIAGPLSDSFGRRRPLVAGLVLYAVASVACAFAPSAYVLVVLRFLQGLGAAAGIVIARAVVRDLFSGIAMARFFSRLMLVAGLAPILAPVLGGELLRFTSWRGIFVVLSVFGVVLLLSTLLGLPETLPATRRQPARVGGVLRSYGSLLRDRVFVGYAMTAALLFAALFAYISGSTFVLQEVYGLTPQQFSLVFGANAVGIMIAGQLSGWLVGRFSSRRLVTIGLVIALVGGAGLVAMTVAGLGLIAILVPLFLIVSSIGIVMPNATALGLADQADNAGAASALIGITQFLVGGISAPLVGAGSGALPMAIVMAALSVLSTLTYAVLTRDKADRQKDDHSTGDQGGAQPATRTGQHPADETAATGEQQLPAC
ncbi:DHA1 family bicyclomycin/chloramphenicol resistance-like MFS transporter [Kibdelosporangium banguiense]|uniref:DHA1 family bicyclomycin/chloramphenicol resistance-like MFS transporter n=1 Tax=Kibdelosporangium banguiense TaxID=1365924 RepID=A0ABS4T654_9PSEU|nr:DHA1 family bicyclomycin/chloramphenicol resistance-like MFS transporter [Kibdelosporangium banguiense]